MAVNTYHLRSSVKGKEPTAGIATGQLPVGSIAINYHQDEPFLSIQDSAGQVRRIAGVKVDATAPTTATAGEFWLDTSGADKILKVFDGTSWVATGAPIADASETVKGIVELATVDEAKLGTDTTRVVTPAGLKATVSAAVSPGTTTPPASPTKGDVYIDASTIPSTVKVWDGTQWIAQVGTSVSSTTAPTTPPTGTVWIDTNTSPAVYKIWDGTKWVTATPNDAVQAHLNAQAAQVMKRTGTTVSPTNAGDTIATTGVTLNGGAATSPLVRDSSGRVGIGSTAPQFALDVNSSASPVAGINSTNANGGGLKILNSGTDRLYVGSAKWIFGGSSLADESALATNGAYSLIFGTNGAERARIDSSGRLLLGTSGSRAVGGTDRAIQIESTGGLAGYSVYRNSDDINGSSVLLGKSRGTAVGSNTVVQSGDALGIIGFYGSDGSAVQPAAYITAYVDGTPGANDMPGRLTFWTTAAGASTPTEAMRIENGGRVMISTTSTEGGHRLSVKGDGSTAVVVRRDTDDGGVIAFKRGSSFVGSIGVTASATSFNTSSDYRLKENITPVTDGITRLQQLKPSRFNFIADPDKTVDGFIAHEAQEVIPECVTGTKDAVDADGKPVYQGIDQSKLVPLLTAALQEAVARIEDLEAKVTALEGGSPMKDDSPRSKSRP